ncbi:MAG: carbonic anhydrase [Candidatus Eremiobacteraeota bacterium]|nr:carbonic anhydrase [Candidatus Eremiobacteraeota bacterium]
MNRTVPPEAALRRLIEGNRRYAADDYPEGMHAHAVNRRHTMAEQRPFAIVLGCSDSRVPIEIVFNQSLGDLFVIRVAGNILNDHVIGSVEYALEMFGSSLVMVLGHSNCGAVTAAVDSVQNGHQPPSRIATIVDAIRPSVESVRGENDLLEAAIAQNVRNVTTDLQTMDPLIATARTQGRLAVVGAEYHLSTGLVTVLCGDLAEPITTG